MGRKWEAEIKAGDILVGKYGYEADIASFYKVLKRTPKQVVIVELEQHRCYDGCMDWTSVPTDVTCGKVLRRKVKQNWNHGGEHVSINSYQSAYVWDGHTERCYNYH